MPFTDKCQSQSIHHLGLQERDTQPVGYQTPKQ